MTAPTVLVTGAGRGIGREIARALAARGARVFAGVRSGAPPPGTTGLRLEVTEEASVAGAVAALRAAGGRLDALVNNAAVLLKEDASILEAGPELLRRTLEVNALAPLRLAQACWPLLRGGGRIVNVSSAGGQLSRGAEGWAPAYCISKTALNAVTAQLAQAGREAGVAVNAVCPGWVRTDMGGPSATRSVEEGADSAVWLVLDAPADLTGAFVKDRRVIPW